MVNLLTEDNLPRYHRALTDTVGRDSAWGEWVHRWTAEEGRHAIAMRDYLLVTRSVDPVQLERERMDHMSRGFDGYAEGSVLTTMAYVSFQELATRISHRNTGKHTDDAGCDRLLARIAADENLHMLFYRNVFAAAFELAPDAAMQAVVDVVENFQMPGNEVEGFTRRSVAIAHGRHLRPAHPPRRGALAGAARVGRLGPHRPRAGRRGGARAPRGVPGRRRRRRHALRAEARREGRPPPRPRLPTDPRAAPIARNGAPRANSGTRSEHGSRGGPGP